jgi:catalase
MYVSLRSFPSCSSHTDLGNPLDLTKEWLREDIPYQEVGKIVLTQNPTNYFAEVEQIGFNPGNMPPGVEPSEDPTLQARLFAYAGEGP